jgi:hypothetical protein
MPTTAEVQVSADREQPDRSIVITGIGRSITGIGIMISEIGHP